MYVEIFSSRPLCVLFLTFSEWPGYSIPVFLSCSLQWDSAGCRSGSESSWLVNAKGASFKPVQFNYPQEDCGYVAEEWRWKQKLVFACSGRFSAACHSKGKFFSVQPAHLKILGKLLVLLQLALTIHPSALLFLRTQPVSSDSEFLFLKSFHPKSPEVLSSILDPNQMHFFREVRTEGQRNASCSQFLVLSFWAVKPVASILSSSRFNVQGEAIEAMEKKRKPSSLNRAFQVLLLWERKFLWTLQKCSWILIFLS